MASDGSYVSTSEFDDIEVQVAPIIDTKVEELVSIFFDSIDQLMAEIFPLLKALVELALYSSAPFVFR